MSSQKFRSWNHHFENTKVESHSEVTLWKMIQDHMLYSLNRNHQHHKWRPQKSWISNPDCQRAQDKQLIQYLFTPRSKWKMHHHCSKIPKSECPDIWIRLPKHKLPESWSSMEDPVVPREQHLYGHPLARLLWERQFEKVLSEHEWEKVPNWERLFVNREKRLFLSVYGWKETKHWLHVENTHERRWFGRTGIIPGPCSFGLHWTRMSKQAKILWTIRNMFESRISAGSTEKLPSSEHSEADISSWSYDMEGHAKKCEERYCELANKTTQQLYKISTPCFDDHQLKEEEMGFVGELWKICPQIVLKCLYLARIGRPDILWSVNKLARAITKWTRACDKWLARLISNIHHTCDAKQFFHVGNAAQQCRLGLFQDSDFAWDLADSKSTSGGFLWIFRSWTFVPISWMCKKQTSVSHSSTEAEIISLDAGLRMDGIPALDLWNLVLKCSILPETNSMKPKVCLYSETCCLTPHQTSTPKTKPRL